VAEWRGSPTRLARPFELDCWKDNDMTKYLCEWDKLKEEYNIKLKNLPSLRTGFKNTDYIILHRSLILFLGMRNTLFLIGISKHYEYLKIQNQVKDGVVFYSRRIFSEQWRMSSHGQIESVKYLKSLGLIRDNPKNMKAPRNQTYLKLSLFGLHALGRLLTHLKKQNISLVKFSEEIEVNKKLRKEFKQQMLNLEKQWKGMTPKEYERDKYEFEDNCDLLTKAIIRKYRDSV